ncbi:MAG TPA: hypothetical protein VNW97_03920 [Candidatus Saccharimonadales bacterium]|jgi:hypothetical protein|nr:hypothetical protein [Candidatus Saccharimonadales bacterium]
MKKFPAALAILLTTAALLAATGCKKHKPNLPPQSQAPPIQGAATPDTAAPQPPVKPPKGPAHSPRTTPPHKPAPVPPATPGNDKPLDPEIAKATPPLPPRIVIQQDSSNDSPKNAPATPLLSHDDAAHNQASTAQLMESTEVNLRAIKRQLSADEQTVISQINDYTSQSKKAAEEGDLLRAHNLALKAHLLSDELVKQR